MNMNKKTRKAARRQRKRRVRLKISGTPEKPRLTVFRSNRNIYAQVVDDEQGSTLIAACSLKAAAEEVPEDVTCKCAIAYGVGRQLAAAAQEKGIARVVFDRNGYIFHGRVAALARGVREGGIEF